MLRHIENDVDESSVIMIFKLFSCLVFLGVAAFWADPAVAEKRVALVIGNGAYSNAPKLDNPVNDAKAITDLLRKSGFDMVESKTDLGANTMRRLLREFSDQLRDADVALVFYAGHGMEVNGVNYLIPVDAVIARDVDVEDEAVSLDRIMRTIEPAKRLQLVILDSCRDNPFVRSMKRTFSSRSVRSGHADIDEKALPRNMLIAYAQRAGQTAEDGSGTNSPYTTALLKHLATPGLDVELALRRVRDEVLRSTRNQQEPFKYGSLGGAELPLVPAPQPTASAISGTPNAPAAGAAVEAWDRIKDTSDKAVLEAFIIRFGDTFFGDLAKGRLDGLKREQEEQHVATLQKRQEEEVRTKKGENGSAAGPARIIGLKLSPLNDELRTKYKIPADVIGVIVLDVDPVSPAAAKSIKVGDIIVEAAQVQVKWPDDVAKSIDNARKAGKRSVLFRIGHGKGDMRFVAVPLT